MRTRMATGMAAVLGLVMTLGVGAAFAAGGLDDLAVYWSGIYPDRDVYQCAQATGTGQHPDPVFEAPHAIGAVILYGVDGRHEVYEDVHTGDRLYAPDREPIATVVKVRWVGVGGYYDVCEESPPTTAQAAPTTTISQETTTTIGETTTTQEETTTTGRQSTTTTSIARESTTTAAVAPTTTVAGVTSSTAATTSTTEVTTTQAPAETSTTRQSETSTTAAAQVTTTTIAPVSQTPEELPFTGFEMGGLVAIGLVLLAGGALVLMREYRTSG